MKCFMKWLAPIFVVSSFAGGAYAQSPRAQLLEMVAQLQKSPADNALREKIIGLAHNLKPPPALPDAAIEFEGRAQFAFKNAKSNEDYLAAAREYEKAVENAPWVSGYYSDLCTIYEKAGHFEDAKRNCEWTLIGLSDNAQITDLKRRIAGLKYGMERNSPSAVAEREKEQTRNALASLEGAVWAGKVDSLGTTAGAFYTQYGYAVRNGLLVQVLRQWQSTQAVPAFDATDVSTALASRRVTLPKGKNGNPMCGAPTAQISEDGESIEATFSCPSYQADLFRVRYARQH